MKNSIKWFLIGGISVILVVIAMVFVSDNVSVNSLVADNGFITNESFGATDSKTDFSSGMISNTDSSSNILGEKVIYTANISLKTDDYQANIANVKNIIEANNGGIANFSERARTQSGSNNTYTYANITVKVPQNNFKTFTNQLKECGMYVSSYTENSEDITEVYMDIESKLVSLKQQEQVLNNLLLQAKNVSEIIEINNQKQQVIQQIEYNTKLKQTYDNKVDYSTVTITIQEVESTQVSQKGIGQRIIDTVISSIEGLKLLLINILLFLVYAIPFVVVLGVFVGIIAVIVKVIKKFRKNNRVDKE